MTKNTSPFTESTYPVQSLTLSNPVADTTIFYRQSGSGPPLLLLHGWGASSIYWLQTLHDLSSNYTCYAIEMPGYGDTPPLTRAINVEVMSEIIIAFADALHIDGFFLNGHSLGGAVAAYIASHYPHRVQRLILTCFSSFATDMEQSLASNLYYQSEVVLTMWRPWLMMWRPWLMAWQCWLAEAADTTKYHQDIARPFFNKLPEDEQLLAQGYKDFMCMDYRTSLESAMSLANPQLRQVIQTIQVPTLLIGAQQDIVVSPSRVISTTHMIPLARVAVIENCGHIPMIEQPTAYHEIIHTFLSG